MGKLIELLNEFMEERKSEYRFTEVINDGDFFLTDKTYGINQDGLGYETIISKKFRFIQRLVKHDKIDFDNRELKDKFMEEFERYPTFHNNTYNQDFNINGLLMLLAISSTPIETLISYLK